MENEDLLINSERKKKTDIVPLLLFLGLFIVEVLVQTLFIDKETKSFVTLSSIVWFTSKIVPLLFSLILFRKYILEKLKFTKDNFKSFIVFTAISFVVFYIFELGASYYQMLMDKMFNTGEATNQEGIYDYFKESSAFINYFVLFITIVIIAPILEELEFRMIIFKSFRGCHFLVPTILSSLIFALAHLSLLTSDSTGNLAFNYTDFVYFPVYFIPGFCLSLIYHYSKENVFSTITVHMIINCISFIGIIAKGL